MAIHTQNFAPDAFAPKRKMESVYPKVSVLNAPQREAPRRKKIGQVISQRTVNFMPGYGPSLGTINLARHFHFVRIASLVIAELRAH